MRIKLFINVLWATAASLMLGSCSQNEESGNQGTGTGEPVDVRFTVGGIADYADGVSVEARGAAEPFTVSVPIDDDYEIEATFTPSQTAQTRAGSTTLAEGVLYRVLAYQRSIYKGYADYKIDGGTSVLVGSDMSLVTGNYTFVAYSYNNSTAIPAISDGAIYEVPVSTSNDFLYWQSGSIPVTDDTSLSIRFSHLLPQMQLTFDATMFGSPFTVASASLSLGGSAPKASGYWTGISSGTTVGEEPTAADDGSFTLPVTSGATTVTSKAKLLLPKTSLSSLTLTVGAEFANGKSVSGKELALNMPGSELKPNASYGCRIRFRPSVVEADTVKAYGGGNCWVFPTDKTKDVKYSFTATEGRTSAEPGATVGATPSNARVVWMDVQGLITEEPTYDSGSNKMTVKVGANKIGNAVIAATAADGTICWSWHIWVVDDNSFMTEPFGTTKFMDRNLGAMGNNSGEKLASYGLFYQWGRKDPFPGAIGVNSGTIKKLYLIDGREASVNPVNGTSTVLAAIKVPLSFFYGHRIWTDMENSNLWVSASDLSKYNPAPKGWTIPTGDVWSGITVGAGGPFDNGLYWNNYGGWYPAAGYMMWDRGILNSVGGTGFYWSRTVIGIQRQAFGFHSYAGQNVYLDANWANGFCLRCVKE